MATHRNAQAPASPKAAAGFHSLIEAYVEEYMPDGYRECELVQSLAESRHRLNRFADIEMSLLEPISSADGDAPSVIASFLKHEKCLRGLHMMEARLQRRFDQDLAELRGIQKARVMDLAFSSPRFSADKQPHLSMQYAKRNGLKFTYSLSDKIDRLLPPDEEDDDDQDEEENKDENEE